MRPIDSAISDSALTARVGILSWVAGTVDAFGYLSLGNVFMTHLTGNVGILGIAVVQRNFHEAFYRGVVFPLFFAGAFVGALLVGSKDDRRQLARAFLIEGALLAAYVVAARALGANQPGASPESLPLLAVLTVAMGIQNAALTRPDTRGTHTTHITGPATDAAIELARLVVEAPRHSFSAARLARFLARPIGFGIGAVSGAWLHGAAPVAAALVPAAVVASVGLVEIATARDVRRTSA